MFFKKIKLLQMAMLSTSIFFTSAAHCSSKVNPKSNKDFLLDFGYVETVSSVLLLLMVY